MTKTNTATATATKTAKATAAKRGPGMEAAAKTRKVLTAEDSKFPTDKALRDQHDRELRASGLPRAAQLARGVKAGQAPHSAKALSDAAAKAKAANKADAVAAKAKAKTDAKAAKAAKAEAKASERQSWKENRTYKCNFKAGEIVAREGTWRRAMLECVVANKTTDAANACCAKNREYGSTHKIDWRWLAKEGYITI